MPCRMRGGSGATCAATPTIASFATPSTRLCCANTLSAPAVPSPARSASRATPVAWPRNAGMVLAAVAVSACTSNSRANRGGPPAGAAGTPRRAGPRTRGTSTCVCHAQRGTMHAWHATAASSHAGRARRTAASTVGPPTARNAASTSAVATTHSTTASATRARGVRRAARAGGAAGVPSGTPPSDTSRGARSADGAVTRRARSRVRRPAPRPPRPPAWSRTARRRGDTPRARRARGRTPPGRC
jgi:hypothetical protein